MLSLCSLCSAFGLWCKEPLRAVCPIGRDVAHVLPSTVLEHAWSEAGISEGFTTWTKVGDMTRHKTLTEIRLILCQWHTGIGWKHCSVQQELCSNMFYWPNSFKPEWTKRILTWSSWFGIDLAFFRMQIDETWDCLRRLFCCSCQDAEDAARELFRVHTERSERAMRAMKHPWIMTFGIFWSFFGYSDILGILHLTSWNSDVGCQDEGRGKGAEIGQGLDDLP